MIPRSAARARRGLELLHDRVRQDALGRAGLHDDVADARNVRRLANGLDAMLHWTER